MVDAPRIKSSKSVPARYLFQLLTKYKLHKYTIVCRYMSSLCVEAKSHLCAVPHALPTLFFETGSFSRSWGLWIKPSCWLASAIPRDLPISASAVLRSLGCWVPLWCFHGKHFTNCAIFPDHTLFCRYNFTMLSGLAAKLLMALTGLKLAVPRCETNS